MKYLGQNNEYFEVVDINEQNTNLIEHSNPSELMVLWIQSDDSELLIDNRLYQFQKNDIVFLTEFHSVKVIKLSEAKLIKWNKYFYCVINHDSEVGCRGILFYGANDLPVVHPNLEEEETLSMVWKMLEQEVRSQDSLQQEMLQMMLKRILLLSIRMYKNRKEYAEIDNQEVDLIREYNFLVETYFKEKHTVAEYAEIMNKSPKTLSNIFKKLGSKPPIQYIKDRKMLEAKRLLKYSDYTVSEVGYLLGFSDLQSFSRFFKREEGISPIQYKD